MSTLYLYGEIRLKRPNSAPKGHKYLQSGRCRMMNRRVKTTQLMIANAFGDGSLSLLPKPAVRPLINHRINAAYFIHRRYLSPLIDFLLNGNGILNNQSCKYPNGQILLQIINLPNRVPVTMNRLHMQICKIFSFIFYAVDAVACFADYTAKVAISF
jgi:hypothetical protein